MIKGEIKQDKYEEKIDLFNIAKTILRNKRLIVSVVLAAMVITAIVSIVMTKIYESKAVIAPIQQPAAQSGLGAVAAQFGIVTPQSANLSEIVNLLKSDILMQTVMEKSRLYDVLFNKNDLKGKSENEKAWAGIRILKKDILNVTESRKDNIITLSAQYTDPVIAQKIVTAVLGELTEYMTAEAKRVAEANRKYLEAQIVNTADPFVRQKIYSLIAQQVETVMTAEAKENFAFKVIDPPRIPDKKVRPKRAQMVVIAFVVSLFLGIFLAFAREHFEKNKEEWREITKLSGLKRFSRKG